MDSPTNSKHVTYYSKKGMLLKLLAVLFILLGYWTYNRGGSNKYECKYNGGKWSYLHGACRPDNELAVVRKQLRSYADMLDSGEIQRVEIRYVNRYTEFAFNCGKNCSDHSQGVNIEFFHDPSEKSYMQFLVSSPLSILLRSVSLKRAKSSPFAEYYWKMNFYNKQNQLLAYIYGDSDTNILVNDSIAVQLDDSLPNWVFSIFDDPPPFKFRFNLLTIPNIVNGRKH